MLWGWSDRLSSYRLSNHLSQNPGDCLNLAWLEFGIALAGKEDEAIAPLGFCLVQGTVRRGNQ